MTIDMTDEAPFWPRAGELGDKALACVLAAFRRMPDVFILAMCLVLALDVVAGSLNGPVYFLGISAHEIFARQSGVVRFLISGLLWLAPLVVMACVAVAVHRFILLQEVTNGLSPLLHRYSWAFVAWLIGVALTSAAFDAPMPWMVRVLAIIPLMIVDIRLWLLFPAVALGAVNNGAIGQLRASWRRTRGRVLSLLYASIVTFLPLFGIMIVLWLVELLVFGVSSQTDAAHGVTIAGLLMLFITSTGRVYLSMCGAAIASLAYRAALNAEVRPEVRGGIDAGRS
jgi:hypothetical protein